MINKKIFAVVCSMIFILSVAGCKKSHAANISPQHIPLQNAGFENGLENWSVLPEFDGQVSIETTNVHGGTKAVKIDATIKNNTPFILYSTKTTGGATYQFSVWARLAPGSSAVSAAVKLESYSGKINSGGWYSTEMLPADGSWKQITLQKQLPADTDRCAFLLRVFGKGAVIFDDAELVMIDAEPEISVLSPAKMAIAPEQKREISYQLALRQPWTAGDLPEITAHIRPLGEAENIGKAVAIPAIVSQANDNQHYKVTFPLPALAATDYTVNFEYHRQNETFTTAFPAYIFTTPNNRQHKSLTENGTILWHNKSFFPIGMYHVGSEADYKLLAANGFNAVQGSAVLDLDTLKSSLDLAQKYGLAVDVPLYNGGKVKANLANSLEKARRFATHPAILNWKIFDEPHINPDGGVATEIPAAYRALKSADPNHPIELTLDSPATREFWSSFCDIVQVDSYPLPRFPLTQVSDAARNARKVIQPWQNLSVVLQSGWVADLHNQPSVAQARSMVYLALIEGAKGIWWYSMYDPGWDLTKTPLWPHMKEINAEIKVLSEPLMSGKIVEGITCDQPKVLFRAVEYKNKTYLLITNPENEPVKATFTLPAKLRSWHPLDGTTSNSLKNHQLSLSLQGVDSRTVVLEE